MLRCKADGFTLAELLATIAIVGVLAFMLLPVAAQQREQARSLTCLSNMQKIAGAIRMYLQDNDNTLPPREHRQEVLDYFDTAPGGRSHVTLDETGHCIYASSANPYLRWPVILDPYVPSRDVWQCPSAQIVGGATWVVPGPDWLGYLQATEGAWGSYEWEAGGPCQDAWPSGWGGPVTDSIAQRRLAVPRLSPIYGQPAQSAFVEGIGTNWWPELNVSEVSSPDEFVIVADGGVQTQDLALGVMAYPDICCLECSGVCGWTDWEICTWARDCGLYRYAPNDSSFVRYVSLRRPYARHRARFLRAGPLWQYAGVNLGYLDGHVAWMASEVLIAKVRDDEISGVRTWGPTTDEEETRPWEECYPGSITIY